MRAVVVTVAAVLASTGAAAPFYLSDLGYIDNTVSPPICYLPDLAQPGSSSRQMPIGPESGNAVGAQWGDIVWYNPRDPDTGVGDWDSKIDSLIVAGRAVTVTIVDKTWDATRGIWIDANPVSGGVVAFSGIALGWATDGDTVTLQMRDNLAVLEQPIQTSFYSGAGSAQGTANNANDPLPKLRGFVSNVTPVLIDPTNSIYQLNDGAISGLTVLEGGIAGFTHVGDFATYAALAAATVTAGNYATCLALGYFRLGVTPVYAITCNLFGAFPSGFVTTSLVDLVVSVLEEDCGIASGSINVANFNAVESALGSPQGGIYTGTDTPTAIDLIGELLGGLGCSVGTDLNGLIDIFLMVDPNTGPTAVASFTTGHILDGVQSIALPDSVAMPNWRRSVSYIPNYTVLSGNDLKPAVTQAQRQFFGAPYSRQSYVAAGVRTLWPLSLDAPLVISRMNSAARALAMVTAMGQLWGAQRYLYDLPFPRDVILPAAGAAVEIGDVIAATYPLGKLASGINCLVVGMSPDLDANTVTLRVFL